MPLLFVIVVIVLIATVGFWDTVAAILGGFALALLLLVALIVLAIWLGLRSFRGTRRR